MSESARIEALLRSLSAAGQNHLADCVARSRALADQLAAIDWREFAVMQPLLTAPACAAAGCIEPAQTITKGANPAADRKAREHGEHLLRSGKVAVFVVAGGQGSRLGFEGPKGLFPATPIRRKSLFQLFAEKILALRERHRASVPWYVMTSLSNHAATVAFFEQQGFFGLPRADVSFFSQDMVPAVEESGRILLEEAERVFLSPNGHGGSLLALHKSGALADMQRRGIDEIFYFQVDNPLVDIADPVFVGYHALARAEMSSKVVPKRNAEEKVGVVAKIDGRYGVIEYSDLAPDLRYATTSSGALRYGDGSIAIHMLRREFVSAITAGGLKLPYHLARKQIACVDPESGERRVVRGVKFETFVFDALSFCERSVVLSVDRSLEFAPIKNAEGEDSPATANAAQTELHARWLERAGARIARDERGAPRHAIEIAPRFAASPADLEARDLAALAPDCDLYLE
jgi:UDP-N-acetylglucosamine/UDP-N-acetylgalactosamine diphosphorylase